MNTNELSDAQLVMLFQRQSDSSAYGELYSRYFVRVHRYCHKIIGNQHDAYDVSADVFLCVAEKLETLQHAKTFSAWLFRIAHNNCMNFFRDRQSKRFLSIEEAHEVEAEYFDIEAATEIEGKYMQMESIMKKLPPHTRSLLVSKYYDGDSLEELMKRHSSSKSAVKMRLLRARNQAQEYLERV